MKLHNEFTVPVPVDRAWEVLLDLERVAPCLPGAQLHGADGSEYRGQMTIKLGPVRPPAIPGRGYGPGGGNGEGRACARPLRW